MTNPSCPKCKSWEEANPVNWIIVATVSGFVTAILTAVFTKWWALSAMERKLDRLALPAQRQQLLGKYRMS